MSEDKKKVTKTYTTNDSEIITVYDIAGNESQEVKVIVNNIDKISPEIEMSYSKTEKTKDDVIVTIIANEEIQEIDGWLLSEDRKSLTKTYTTNSSQLIHVYDLVGNTAEVQLNIDNIDKTAPSVEVKSSKEEMTNGYIIVTIIANEEIQEVDGWELSTDKLTLTKTYNKNVEEKIKVKDLVGNITEVDINLINIDTTEPELKLEYSETNITNGDVVVIITSEELLQEVNGWELSKDKKTLTKTYEKNQKETIEIKDLAGNITKVEINISNIDKVIPTVKIEYSNLEKTNEDVIVTITSNEEIQNVKGWELSDDKLTLTKTYQKNTQEIVIIKDLANNALEKNVEISNIDKEKPILKVEYNLMDGKYVIVKIISNEQLQKIEGWELSEDKKTLTKTYQKNIKATFEIKDLTGNIALAEINIDNIETQLNENEKDAADEIDKSTAPGILPNAGATRGVILSIVVFGIFLGVILYKLKKYKDI